MAEAQATENPDEFSLKTTEKQGGLMKDDGTYHESFGGTELMSKALTERLPSELLEQFNIIKSRVRKVSEDKPNVLWLHDLWNDPENQHLSDAEARKRFARLVFVSNYQMNTYQLGLGVPFSESFVLKNAIEPILVPGNTDGTWKKPDDGFHGTVDACPRPRAFLSRQETSQSGEPCANALHLRRVSA